MYRGHKAGRLSTTPAVPVHHPPGLASKVERGDGARLGSADGARLNAGDGAGLGTVQEAGLGSTEGAGLGSVEGAGLSSGGVEKRGSKTPSETRTSSDDKHRK